MNSVRQYLNEIGKPLIVVKWKVKTGNQLFLSSTVLTYVHQKENGDADDSKELKLKSSVEGKVLQILVKEGDVAQPGSPLLELESCTHELIIKEICAQCGSDLWRSGLCENLPQIGLKVTHEQAEKLKTCGEVRLLEERKLALLMCLDKIFFRANLINPVTSKELVGIPMSSESENYSQINDIMKFLAKVSSMYDVHFYTCGDTRVAKQITQRLDNWELLSSKKVWTMENICHSSLPSHSNEFDFFPRGDSMVCVLEWKNAHLNELSNVEVKPFCCLLSATSPSVVPEHSEPGNAGASNGHLEVPPCVRNGRKAIMKRFAARTYVSSRKSKCLKFFQRQRKYRRAPFRKFTTRCFKTQTPKSKESCKIDILCCLNKILSNIHKTYYNLYDQMVRQRMYVIHQKVIPEMKNVIPYIRKNVLKGVNIVFSGLIPANTDPEEYPLWALAKSIGANVNSSLVFNDVVNGTTHIVAARLGTDKLNSAKKISKIFIVTTEWLLNSARCWERLDEKLFPLTSDGSNEDKDRKELWFNEHLARKELAVSKTTEVASEIVDRTLDQNKLGDKGSLPKDGKQRQKNLTRRLSTILNMSSKDLAEMNREVDTECTKDETDSDGDALPYVKRKRTCQRKHKSPLGPKRRKSTSLSSLGTITPEFDKRGNFKTIRVPIWERPCTSEISDASDSSCQYDYIYSEDDDNLL